MAGRVEEELSLCLYNPCATAFTLSVNREAAPQSLSWSPSARCDKYMRRAAAHASKDLHLRAASSSGDKWGTMLRSQKKAPTRHARANASKAQVALPKGAVNPEFVEFCGCPSSRTQLPHQIRRASQAGVRNVHAPILSCAHMALSQLGHLGGFALELSNK